MAKASAREGSPWYRLADLCRLFDCSERTVWTWVSIGKLPEPRRRGRRWTRWTRLAIDAQLAAEGALAAPEGGAA